MVVDGPNIQQDTGAPVNCSENQPQLSRSISVPTIGEAWISSIRAVIDHGIWYHDENVPLLELQGLCLHVDRPSPTDPLIAEVGDTEVLGRMLSKFSATDHFPRAPFTYGQRLYDNQGIDQVAWLVERIRKRPETKSAAISLLVPGDQSRHVPCLTTIDVKLRFQRVDLSFFFRSQNVFGRQFANLVALATLQGAIATMLNATAGSLSGYISSAHIYEFDLAAAKAAAEGTLGRMKDVYYDKGPVE